MPDKTERINLAVLKPSNAKKISEILLKWGQDHYQNYPWRDPAESWHGLIAEILLQRTRADSVVPVYQAFIKEFPSFSDLSNASVEEIEKLIYPLGLRWRAPLLKKLGKKLTELNGDIPLSLDSLLALPGVGPYAASAWLGFHGGYRGVIIDANVVRFISRLLNRPKDGETRRQKWLIETADLLTPQNRWKSYNYAILDFTMQICTTRPKCEICPLSQEFCAFGQARLGKG